MIACVMNEDARARLAAAAVYEAEAERARQWAGIRRTEARNEDERAERLSALAARLRRSPPPTTPIQED